MPEVKPHTTITADESCTVLTGMLRKRKPFFFTKFGDGALELLYYRDKKLHTCDGEEYTAPLADDMLEAINDILESPNTFLGDWLSMTSGPAYYIEEYRDLIGDANPFWLHFETVLLMRQSPELRAFYQALKDDPRRKVFMGPHAMAGAAASLGAHFIPTPMSGLHAYSEFLLEGLRRHKPELLIWCAGMAGHIPVAKYWKESGATCVNLGSALDILYRGKTRAQQLHPIQATEFLRGIF